MRSWSEFSFGAVFGLDYDHGEEEEERRFILELCEISTPIWRCIHFGKLSLWQDLELYILVGYLASKAIHHVYDTSLPPVTCLLSSGNNELGNQNHLVAAIAVR
jgi:hypothetical protein